MHTRLHYLTNLPNHWQFWSSRRFVNGSYRLTRSQLSSDCPPPCWPSLPGLLALLGILVMALPAQAQISRSNTRYVKVGGTGDGSSWLEASGDLQAMINASGVNQQVWVAAGTYKPTSGSDRYTSFAMKNGVALYGGFSGNEFSLSQRPVLNPVTGNPSSTTLSGDIGVAGNDDDNSYHVINNPSGLNATAMLDGFVISGGRANYSKDLRDPGAFGGGMYNTSSSPRVANCLFQANSAYVGGGLFNNNTSNPSMSNCSFVSNSANNGGGLANYFSSPTLTACHFARNSTVDFGDGAGIYNSNSSPSLITCSFVNNTAAGTGGGIYNNSSGISTPTITGCRFVDNSAINGGGMANYSCNPTLSNCLFQSNAVSGVAGAILNETSRPNLINCQLLGNTAANLGGGIVNNGSSPNLVNCTIRSNAANYFGGGMFNGMSSQPNLTNCVVFGNGGVNTFTSKDASSVKASYSLFDASVTDYTGSMNLTTTTSPFLSDTDARLNTCSAAINAGDNSVNTTTTDLAGNPRVYGGIIDLGAYEYQMAPSKPVAITTQPPSASNVVAGASVSVPVSVSGTASAYQWYKDGSAVSGQTTATLTLNNVQPAQAGSYSLVISGACNSLNSTVFTLSVSQPLPIRYVKQGGTGDGSSWANASGNLQGQIDALGVEQVWVAAGTYKPTIGTDRSISFSLKDNVAIYGGFPTSGNPELNDRNPARFSSILSGEIGDLSTIADNSYHVIRNVENDLSIMAILDGFTVTGGNANGVMNFSNDTFDGAGGGIFINRQLNFSSGPTLTNIQFSQNAANYGGAMYIFAASPPLTNISFSQNSATQDGGALYCDGRLDFEASPELTSVRFDQNRAVNGGAMYNRGRQAASSTGRVYAKLTNVSFIQNTATNKGGAIYNEGEFVSLKVTGGSMSQNAAVSGGSVIYASIPPHDRPSLLLTNGVLFGNGVNTFGVEESYYETPYLLTYSLLDANIPAGSYTNNATNRMTAASPFVSARELSLNPCSPAINAGDPASTVTTNGTTDLAGNPRFFANGRIDMGAFEYQDTPSTPVAVTAQPPSASIVVTGGSVSVPVSASGSVSSYQWYKDGSPINGQTSATLNLTNVHGSDAGSYALTITGTCNSLTSTVFKLTVQIPVTKLTALTANPASVCAGQTIHFSATVDNPTDSYSYALTNGTTILTGTATGAMFSQNVTASGLGIQTFTLTISNAYGSVSASVVVRVNEPPTASLTSDGPLSCTKISVILSANTGEGLTYRFSSGANPIENSNRASVTTAGLYSVTVVTTSGCSSVASTTVTGNQTAPTVYINPTSGTLTCASPTITLTATTNAPTIRWNTGQTTADITVNAVGTYSVTATGSNGCAATSNPVVIESSQSAPPATLAASGGLSCAVTSVTLTANTGNDLSYRFSSGATQIGVGNTATVNVGGTYSVSVTNTATGCTNSASVVVNQDNSQPTVTIDPTTSASLSCGVPSVTLTAITSASSLIWSTGQTTPSISVSVAGTYSVTITSANGCMAMAQATVSGTTNSPTAPTLAASPATTTTNQPIIITASGCSGGMINWALSGGSGQAGPTSFTLTQPGNYSLTASCRLNACTSAYSPLLALQIRPGGFAITGVSLVNCQLIDEAKGGYQVQFTPQYAGQTNLPISFSVVNELATTTAPAPYSLRLYTDNPVIILVATQAGNSEARFSYNWLASCQSGTSPNQPPTTTGIPSQSILVGQGYQLPLTTYFSDPDGQSLTFQALGLPTGLTLNGSLISGTPSQTGVSTVRVTALDPLGLSVSTSFPLTVSPMPVTPPTGFAIVGVSTVSCSVLSAGERRLTFTPQYGGVSGAPISFSVVNELVATTSPGPYSLNLYPDNPTITLSAQQGALVSTYRYNWLAVCTPAARVGGGETGNYLQVRVLGNPVEGHTAQVEISGASGQAVQLNLVDLQGKPVATYRVDQAGAVERVTLPLGASTGVLLLQVSTPTQYQQLKLVRP